MRIAIVTFMILLPVYVLAERIKPPTLTPALTNQEEQAVIDEGTTLRDQGKSDEAIAKFKQVLEKSPANVLAMYELATTYFSAKRYEDALKMSYEGARYKCMYLPKFYQYIGYSLDELGKTNDAINAFNEALEVEPGNAMIHFNLGAILINSGKPAAAQLHLEKAIELNPTHSSSHYALSQVYFEQKEETRGILALLRFLSLEPESKRSMKALGMLDEHLASNGETDDSKKKELEHKITVLNDLFKTELVESNEGKFLKDHYFYFHELQKHNLVPGFTYFIYQSANPEAATWVEQHSKEMQEFREWSKHPTGLN